MGDTTPEEKKTGREKVADLDRLYKELILTHGAGVDDYGQLKVHGKDRINKAVEIFKDGYSPRIIMSGRGAAKKMKEYAVREHGVSEGKILVDNTPISTYMEIKNAKEDYLEPENLESIYLVSNYWHGPRISNVIAPALLKGYSWKFEGAPDSRPDEERAPDIKSEFRKNVRDKILSKTVYKMV